MPHDRKNLIMLDSGGVTGSGPGVQSRMHLGATLDTAAVVEAANYFNGSADLLQKGDVLMMTMARGGTPVLKLYVVTAISAVGVVTIALQSTTAG